MDIVVGWADLEPQSGRDRRTEGKGRGVRGEGKRGRGRGKSSIHLFLSPILLLSPLPSGHLHLRSSFPASTSTHLIMNLRARPSALKITDAISSVIARTIESVRFDRTQIGRFKASSYAREIVDRPTYASPTPGDLDCLTNDEVASKLIVIVVELCAHGREVLL